MTHVPLSLQHLPSDKFNRQWRAASAIIKCRLEQAQPFIQAHYLHKRPAIVTLCLLLSVCSLPVGVAIFGMPPREANKRYGGWTWELARLFIEDFVPRNAETFLVARAIRYIKRYYPAIKFLLSYADPSARHHGGIYIAGGWKRDGRTDDDRKTPRKDVVDLDTGKVYGRWSQAPATARIGKKDRVSKFRFVYPL